MKAESKYLLWLVALVIADFVTPFVPVLGIFLGYVVFFKPPWFAESVRELYGD